MNRNVPAILFPLFFVFILAHPGATVTGNDILELKKAGVSDKTIELIVIEKVIETAAFSVDDIVNMKKAGVTDKTMRILIEEGSFLGNTEPIIYGRETQSIRHLSAQQQTGKKRRHRYPSGPPQHFAQRFGKFSVGDRVWTHHIHRP